MNLTYYYHRNSNLLVEDEEFEKDYQELVNALETISDKDLENGFLSSSRENIKAFQNQLMI